MIKKLYLPLVALLVLAFSSCSKMGELLQENSRKNTSRKTQQLK